MPSNEIALPYLPVVIRVAPPSRVPTLPAPEASAVVGPPSSLKPYAATKPGITSPARVELLTGSRNPAVKAIIARITHNAARTLNLEQNSAASDLNADFLMDTGAPFSKLAPLEDTS